MRKIFGGVVGFFIGGLVGSIFGDIGMLIGVIIGIMIGISSGGSSGSYSSSGSSSGSSLGLCSSCLGIQLHGMTVRGLVSGEAFDSFEGKLALLLHLKDKGGCSSCIDKAKRHAKAFGGPGADAVVDDFYRNA
jgi:hypothetical protein